MSYGQAIVMVITITLSIMAFGRAFLFPPANGINGVNGTRGINGTNGETGPMGPMGPQGIQGLQGIPGINGTTPVNHLTNITVLENTATRVYDNTTGNYTVNFTIHTFCNDSDLDNIHVNFYVKFNATDDWYEYSEYIHPEGYFGHFNESLAYNTTTNTTEYLYWLVEVWDGQDLSRMRVDNSC